MIRQFKINNFKSHKDTTIDLSNLTVFCGANAVGKSTAMNALLLLRESFFANSNFDYLDLKPNPVNIGTISDALYQFAEENIIAFELKTDIGKYAFNFKAKDAEMTKTLIYKTEGFNVVYEKTDLMKESLFKLL